MGYVNPLEGTLFGFGVFVCFVSLCFGGVFGLLKLITKTEMKISSDPKRRQE